MAVVRRRFIGHTAPSNIEISRAVWQLTALRRAGIKDETDKRGHDKDTLEEDLQTMGVTGTERSKKCCKR